MPSRASKKNSGSKSAAPAPANLQSAIAGDAKPVWKFLLVVTLAALAIRLIAMCFLYTETYNDFDNHLLFGFEIGRIARSLALGHGFANPMLTDTGPTAWVTPVYPYILAGVFKLFGVFTKTSAFAILSVNSIFSSLICIPVFFAARRGFGRKRAAVAAWIWALWPYSIYIASSFVWETCLSALIFALLFAWTLRLQDRSSVGEGAGGAGYAVWLGFGLLWGVEAMTNSSVLSVLPFLLIWALNPVWRVARGRAVKSAALVAIGLIVFIAPWQVRNYRTFYQRVPLRDTFWVAFWVGNDGNTVSWADAAVHPTVSAPEQAEFVRQGEIPYTQAKRRQSLEFLSRHRALFVVTSLRRFVYFWTAFWNLNPANLAVEFRGASNVFLTSLLTLAMALGLWQGIRLRRAAMVPRAAVVPYILVLVFYPMVYYITVPEIRYRHMIEPEMVILAALGAQFLVSELKKGFPGLARKP